MKEEKYEAKECSVALDNVSQNSDLSMSRC